MQDTGVIGCTKNDRKVDLFLIYERNLIEFLNVIMNIFYEFYLG